MNRLIACAQNGDAAARDRLVEENMGLVHMIAHKFKNRGAEYEDLAQIGTIGLIKALERFDLSLDYKFSTYAVTLIMGEIKKFLRDDGLLKVSRSLKETAAKVCAAKEKLEGELGREPKISEIAGRLGISSEDVVLSLEAAQPTESLQKTVGSGDGKDQYLIDVVKAPGDTSDQLVDKIALREAISSFEPREREVILLRYFKQKTQSEIARMLGISQVTVSRLEKRVLAQLREKLSG